MNNKKLGTWGENLAAEYLVNHGYEIVDRNYRSRLGEIDIIARRGELMIFVEVKTRSSERFGRPGAAVNYFKQRKIIQMAQVYIRHKNLQDCHFRFDVMEILKTPTGTYSVNHIQGAFET